MNIDQSILDGLQKINKEQSILIANLNCKIGELTNALKVIYADSHCLSREFLVESAELGEESIGVKIVDNIRKQSKEALNYE